MRLIFPLIALAALGAASSPAAAQQEPRAARDCTTIADRDARRDCEREERDRIRERERAERERVRERERAARERSARSARGSYNFDFDYDVDAGSNRDRQGRPLPTQVDTTFAFAAGGWAELNLGSGEIIVSGWNEPRARVRATTERGGVRLDVTGGQLSVSVRDGGSRPRGRIEVTLPVGTRITASSQSAEITVRGTRGRVRVSTMSGDVIVEDAAELVELNSLSGDVRLSRIAGDVEAHAVSGDIDLADSRGDIEIQTVSGDVDLRAITAKRVRANTTSGEVFYDGTIDADGRYLFSSTSGDLSVALPAGIGANVTLKTFSGEVDSAFPITLQPGEHRIGSATGKRFTFDVGRGGAEVSLETFSGDITLSQHGTSPRAPRP